jgi:hypothetical protein
LILGLVLASAAVLPSVSRPAQSTRSGPNARGACSKATALATVAKIHYRPADYVQGVFEVLCGPFAGKRSQIMTASFFGPGNVGVIDWAIFSLADGDWQLLVGRHEAVRLAAVGSDIQETMDVYRSNDPRCCPSGGSRSRIWHWNGTRFSSTAWQYSKPQATWPPPGATLFYSPSRNLSCGMVDRGARDAGVHCQSMINPHAAILTAEGKLTVCRGFARSCVGNPGEGDITTVLAYGKTVTRGRFRCRSDEGGVTCIVIAGTGTGRGFLIDKDGVRRVGQ